MDTNPILPIVEPTRISPVDEPADGTAFAAALSARVDGGARSRQDDPDAGADTETDTRGGPGPAELAALWVDMVRRRVGDLAEATPGDPARTDDQTVDTPTMPATPAATVPAALDGDVAPHTQGWHTQGPPIQGGGVQGTAIATPDIEPSDGESRSVGERGVPTDAVLVAPSTLAGTTDGMATDAAGGRSHEAARSTTTAPLHATASAAHRAAPTPGTDARAGEPAGDPARDVGVAPGPTVSDLDADGSPRASGPASPGDGTAPGAVPEERSDVTRAPGVETVGEEPTDSPRHARTTAATGQAGGRARHVDTGDTPWVAAHGRPDRTEPAPPHVTAETARSERTPTEGARAKTAGAGAPSAGTAGDAPTAAVHAQTAPRPPGPSDAARAALHRIPLSVVERIERAARDLEHAPPPRSVVIHLAELDAAVRVTLRGDRLHLAPTTPGPAPSWLADAERALEAGGFTLAGRDGRGGDGGGREGSRDERPPTPGGTRTRRPTIGPRPDDDLRL